VTNPGAPTQWGTPQPPSSGSSAANGWGVLGKRRHPLAVWLGLPLITLGIYGLVWVYKTNRELSQYDRRVQVNPAMSVLACTLGVVLVVPPFVAVWRLGTRTAQAQRAAGVAEVSPGLSFLLFVVGFGPLYLQSQINKIWARYPVAVEGQQVPLAA